MGPGVILLYFVHQMMQKGLYLLCPGSTVLNAFASFLILCESLEAPGTIAA